MSDADPRLTIILDAIADAPDDPDRWFALASWLWDNGRAAAEAVAVRVLWPMLRDDLRFATLADVARNAKVLAAVARTVERQADDTPPV